MSKQIPLLLFLLLLLSVAAPAQSQKKHPIDKALEACLGKDSSTSGMANCAQKAEKMWDQELNRVYNELARKLNAEGKQALKAAQTDWLKYRDSEFKLIGQLYSQKEGTMYIPMRAEAIMEVVRQRALELKEYLDLLDE